ncbi:MAG: IS3 family transposase [Chloroflexota bacterium]
MDHAPAHHPRRQPRDLWRTPHARRTARPGHADRAPTRGASDAAGPPGRPHAAGPSGHDHTRPHGHDRVGRHFTTPTINTLWFADITYVPTDEGWLYLASLLDACSRRIVGWALADHLRTELATEALTMALAHRKPDAGLVHHSDRGCQYTARAYGEVLEASGALRSVGSPGVCWDNAVAESFFATLKTELIHRHRWPTRQAATTAIFEYIEAFYNRARLHSGLGYLSPLAFERRLTHTTSAA